MLKPLLALSLLCSIASAQAVKVDIGPVGQAIPPAAYGTSPGVAWNDYNPAIGVAAPLNGVGSGLTVTATGALLPFGATMSPTPPDVELFSDYANAGPFATYTVAGLAPGFHTVLTHCWNGAGTTNVIVPGAPQGPTLVLGFLNWQGRVLGLTTAIHTVLITPGAPLVITTASTNGDDPAPCNGFEIYDGLPSAGQVYCTSLPNVTLRTANISAVTSIDVRGNGLTAANDLTLSSGSLPPGVFCQYLASAMPLTPPAAVGNGILCVATPFVRLPLGLSGPGGAFSTAVDNTTIPFFGGTMYFQLSFRDPTPVPSVNFSDAIAIPFI